MKKDIQAIYVDADATPGISIIEKIAKKHARKLFLYFDHSHEIYSDYATCILCDTGTQSVDMMLINAVKKHDIVITQDYGLAALCLAKGSYALHPKGFLYTSDTIESLLATRYENMKRKRKKGPKKRTKEDDRRLALCLEELLKKVES